MTLEERVARERGMYLDSGTGWDIPVCSLLLPVVKGE